MKTDKIKILRVAVGISKQDSRNYVIDSLIRFAIKNDIELDIAEITMDFKSMKSQMENVDLAFFAYNFLKKNEKSLHQLYELNPRCISVPIGEPAEEICRYLTLRPCAYMSDACEYADVEKICLFCLDTVGKSDNTLQISTKNGFYRVTLSSIIYCQSDMKYVSFITKEGKTYRKLGKLDDISSLLGSDFIRIHQSYLVNIKMIVEIDKSNNLVILLGDTRLPYSRVYKNSLISYYQNGIFNV